MRWWAALLTLVMLVPGSVTTQVSGPILPADIGPGDRLSITAESGDRFTGRLIAEQAGSLVLSVADRDRAVPYSEIVRVTKRRNRFFLGPLIGLAAGLAVGLPLKRRFENEAADGGPMLAWSVGIGVAVGSLVIATHIGRSISASGASRPDRQSSRRRSSDRSGWSRSRNGPR